MRPGNSLKDIAGAIQPYVESEGFSVIRDLVGHGVGYSLHEDPNVPNYIFSGANNLVLEPGMVLALEPMTAMGSFRLKEEKGDHFAFYTADYKPSAHFEHTVAVVEDGHQVLTLK